MRLRAIAIATFAVFGAARAEACSCIVLDGPQAEQVRHSLSDAQAVFRARLTRSSVGPDRIHRTRVMELAHFQVLEVFKGPYKVGQVVVVNQVLNPGMCGQSSTNDPPWMFAQKKPHAAPEPVKFSKEWVIYAYGAEPLELSRCTRSAPLNAGGDDDVKVLRRLSKGRPPK